MNDESSILSINETLAAPVITKYSFGTVAIYNACSPERTDNTNGDSVGVFDLLNNAGVLAIADGAGGTPGGDKASGELNATLRTELTKFGADSGPSTLREIILDVFDESNQLLLGLKTGAASTFSVVEVSSDAIRAYHVGDSPIWVIGKKGKVKFETITHSPAGYALESGLVKEGDISIDDKTIYVNNLVGTKEMRIDVGPSIQLESLDTVVICSDGISDNLSKEEIFDIIRLGGIEEAATNLIKNLTERLEKGKNTKPDDHSFILFRPL